MPLWKTLLETLYDKPYDEAVICMGRRDALIECFGDTMRLCRSEELAGRVEASREETRLIGVSDAVDAPETVPSQSTVRVSVTPDRTFEAAQRLVTQSPDSRCAVLNFASPVNPAVNPSALDAIPSSLR